MFSSTNFFFSSSPFQLQFYSCFQVQSSPTSTAPDPNAIDWDFYTDDTTYYALLNSATSLGDYVDLARFYPQHRSTIITDYLVRMYQLGAHDILLFIDGADNTYMADDITGARIATGLLDTLSTLETLGNLFPYIKIEIKDHSVARDVAGYMETYCQSVVHDIVLQRHFSDQPTGFWFPRTTRVILNYMNAFTDTIDLRMLFPQMERLELLNTPYQPLLEREFQALTQFVIISPHTNTNPDIWRPFLKLNQQIRTFESPILWKFEFLKMINAELPNLETLSIKYLQDPEHNDGLVNGTVRFKNVKTYSLDLMHFKDEWNMEVRYKLSNIQFAKLETFLLASDITELADGWVELIGRNPTVHTVETKSFEIPYAYLMRLAQLVQLKKLSLECFREETVADTKKFLTKKNRLTELAVCTNAHGRTELLKDLPSAWKVDDDWHISGKDYLLFRRK